MAGPVTEGGRVVAWRRDDDQRGHSTARLAPGPEGWTAHGAEVLAGPDEVLSCRFRVDLDRAWRTRRAEVTAFSAVGERRLLLTADPQRRWTRDGDHAPDLDGCDDVDVAATPLTNTFPIRRSAALPLGAVATFAVAWVDLPSLTVTRVDQTYTRLGPLAWRYHDDTHGDFELTVDADGLVVDYAGLAARVWP